MEIIVNSRGMKASDILDMAFDAGLQNPKISTAGEWDGGRTHIITYGSAAYRKILEIPAPAKKDDVERLLRSALISAEAKKLDGPKAAVVTPVAASSDEPVTAPKPKPKAKRR